MIYLDNSATTQPCHGAIEAMDTMVRAQWLNPSAAYAGAVEVEKRLAAVRQTLLAALGAPAGELVFTGSGTEADALALLGTAARMRGRKRILLFAGEHSAVLKAGPQMERMGHEVHFIPATTEGLVDQNALAALLTEDVGLVSVMHVNNETGAIQPIQEVSHWVKGICPEALFHVDGIQGFLHVPFALSGTEVDLYAISAHKVHGPKGVGALFIKKGVQILPQVMGGGQEGGLRSGTENTPGIAAFGAAAAWAQEQGGKERLLSMKLLLYNRLLEAIDGIRVNGPPPDSPCAAPHILNVSFPGVGGEVMLHALEGEGVLVGTGAACSAKKRAMSPAFAAMKAPEWAAESAIRFSFGYMSTDGDAHAAADAAIACYRRYRAFQRR